MELIHAVFTDERFAALRFTGDEVEAALDHVGFPKDKDPDEEEMKLLLVAIVHLATKERRQELSLALLMHVLDYVRSKRFMEAWLVSEVAFEMEESPQESNPFLQYMFSFGFDEMVERKLSLTSEIMKRLGVDKQELMGMGMEISDRNEYIKAKMLESANVKIIEEFYRENPHFYRGSEEILHKIERDVRKLLAREDSRWLFLTEDEVEPWVVKACEQLSSPEVAELAKNPTAEFFSEYAVPLLREMVEEIFDHERIQKLIADLKQYRETLNAAGDSKASQLVQKAIGYLDHEDSLELHTFLIALCWESILVGGTATIVEDENE